MRRVTIKNSRPRTADGVWRRSWRWASPAIARPPQAGPMANPRQTAPRALKLPRKRGSLWPRRTGSRLWATTSTDRRHRQSGKQGVFLAEGHVHDAMTFAEFYGVAPGYGEYGLRPKNNAELCSFKTCASGCDSEPPPRERFQKKIFRRCENRRWL